MLNKEFEKIWKFHQWSDKRDSCLRHVSTCLWNNASWMLDRRWINIDYFIVRIKKKAVFEPADWLYLSRRNGAGIHQSRVCLPSLKKRMGSSLSYRFLEHARNWRNLISWFRKLETKDFSRKIKQKFILVDEKYKMLFKKYTIYSWKIKEQSRMNKQCSHYS